MYIAVLGFLLTIAPNFLLGLVNIPTTSEVWINLVGMLLIFMGFFYIQTGRHNLLPFFKWTLFTRGAAFFFVMWFWLSGMVPWLIITFWLGDLAGALWTFFALRAEGHLG